MDPFRSDIGVTSPVTSGHSTTRKQHQQRRRTAKGKAVDVTPSPPTAARKLEPYQPKASFRQPSEVQSGTTMPLSLFKGLFAPKEPLSDPKTVSLENLSTTMIHTVEEEEPWDSFQDTTRTSNTAVKDVKKPLYDEEDDYIDDYMPTDDDIDSLADTSGDLIRISPYPGPLEFGAWCESQFPNVIPKGTAEFLDQFNILSEADVYHWINLDAREYLKLLGPEQYDNAEKTEQNYALSGSTLIAN